MNSEETVSLKRPVRAEKEQRLREAEEGQQKGRREAGGECCTTDKVGEVPEMGGEERAQPYRGASSRWKGTCGIWQLRDPQ